MLGVPKIDNQEHQLWLITGNQHGATNTKIRRFLTIVKLVGDAIQYNYGTEQIEGAEARITQNGVYTITYTEGSNTTGDSFGISVNSRQLTTSVASITVSTRPAYTVLFPGNGVYTSCITATEYLHAGDIVRPHTSGGADFEVGPGNSIFKVTKHPDK